MLVETGPWWWWWSLALSCGASCGGPWWDWDEPRGRTRKKLPRIDWRGFGASLTFRPTRSIDEGVGVVVVVDGKEQGWSSSSSWSWSETRTLTAFPDLTASARRPVAL